MLYLCRSEEVAVGGILRVDPPNHEPLAVYNLEDEEILVRHAHHTLEQWMSAAE